MQPYLRFKHICKIVSIFRKLRKRNQALDQRNCLTLWLFDSLAEILMKKDFEDGLVRSDSLLYQDMLHPQTKQEAYKFVEYNESTGKNRSNTALDPPNFSFDNMETIQ